MFKLVMLVSIAITTLLLTFIILIFNKESVDSFVSPFSFTTTLPAATPTPSPQITLLSPSTYKTLPNEYHVYQTFNNCGPAALSMLLSYYGIHQGQQALGQSLRPFQNPQGNNDDKSVTLIELAEKARDYNLIPYHRPNGNIDLIKLFITYDIPVVARTLLDKKGDIGHYRIVKGFDDTSGQLIQDDSMQGRNIKYSYEAFNLLWQKFNYEYLVLVPKDKQSITEAILKDDQDIQKAWAKTAESARTQLSQSPNDIYTKFNLAVALFYLGNYQAVVEAFEQVEESLPFRTLWYQIEPVQGYFELGDYQRVLTLTDKIINNDNRAFSELYLLRGQAYLKQGNIQTARQEFEKAVFYNQNLKQAQVLLNSLP